MYVICIQPLRSWKFTLGKKPSLSPYAHLSLHPNVWITNMRIAAVVELEFDPSIWADARSSYVTRSRLCSQSGPQPHGSLWHGGLSVPDCKINIHIHGLGWDCWSRKLKTNKSDFLQPSIWLVYLRFTYSNNSTWGGGCERLCSWYGRVLFDTMTAIGDGSMFWWAMISAFGCAPSSTSGEGRTLGLWKSVPQLLWTAKVDGNHVGFLGGHLNDNCNTASRELGRPNFIEGTHHKM